MSYSKFHPDRSRNMKSTCRNSLATLSKAWLLLGRFIRNSHTLGNLFVNDFFTKFYKKPRNGLYHILGHGWTWSPRKALFIFRIELLKMKVMMRLFVAVLSISFITYHLPRKHLSSKSGSNWLKNFSDFDGITKLFAVRYHVYSNWRHCGIWKQRSRIHTLTPYFFNVNLNIIFLFRLRSFFVIS